MTAHDIDELKLTCVREEPAEGDQDDSPSGAGTPPPSK